MGVWRVIEMGVGELGLMGIVGVANGGVLDG